MNNLSDIIKEIALSNNYTDYELIIHEIDNKGLSYMSKTYNITLKDNEKYMKLFVKEIVRYEKIRDLMGVDEAFERELFLYNKIAKKYQDYQSKYKVPPNEEYKFAKIYGGIDEDNKEFVILEDLIDAGYKTHDRFEATTTEFADQVVKAIAKFHVLSIVHKKEDLEDFETNVTNKYNFIVKRHGSKENSDNLVTKYIKTALSVLNDLHKDVKLEEHCRKYSYYDFAQPTEKALLVHGDLKVPNIFVKYENSKITSIIPIDYQMVNYAHPLDDLLYFLLANVDPDFRRSNFDRCVNLYYESFGSFLIHFNLDIKEVYPRTDFDQDLQERLKFNLVEVIVAMPFLCLTEKDLPGEFRFGEMYKTLLKIKDNEEYIKRINALVEDFVNWKIL